MTATETLVYLRRLRASLRDTADGSYISGMVAKQFMQAWITNFDAIIEKLEREDAHPPAWEALPAGAWFYEYVPHARERHHIMERTAEGSCVVITIVHYDALKIATQIIEAHNGGIAHA